MVGAVTGTQIGAGSLLGEEVGVLGPESAW